MPFYPHLNMQDADSKTKCNQGCGRDAEVYAIDPAPGGWGGYYCLPCCAALRFQITDRLNKEPRDA